HEEARIERDELAGTHPLDACPVRDPPPLRQRPSEPLRVEPLLPVDGAVDVRHPDDAAAEGAGDETRRPRADVAESLDDDASTLRIDPGPSGGVVQHERHATRGGLLP